MKRRYGLIIVLLVLSLLFGCDTSPQVPETRLPATVPDTTEPPTTTPQETEPDLSSDTTHKFLTDDPVLIARREAVEAYMRKMGTLIWRCPKDILYTITAGVTPEEAPESSRLELKAGRLYRGLPYSYAGSTLEAFLAFSSETEVSGIPVVGEFDWQTISGSGMLNARVGNDCSSALAQAWSQVGASIEMTSTKYMARALGYLRVGKYTSDYKDNTNSTKHTKANGEQKMYEAYAQLQMGDGVVCRTSSSGHTMMAVEIRVVRGSDGRIDGEKSVLTVHEQTRTLFKAEKKYYDATLGENVYYFFGIDREYTFASLYEKGYLPITCKELTDPAPLAEPIIQDSVGVFDKQTLCQGILTANYFMDGITMTITGEEGTVCQQGTIFAVRGKNTEVDLQRFLTERPDQIRGEINPEALTPGQYHCTVTVRLTDEREITVRDFDFTVE